MSASRILAVEGRNFSGRTEYLKRFVSDQSAQQQAGPPGGSVPGAYVGIDAHNYLSGLLPTVHGELALHGYHESPRRSAVADILSCINFEEIAPNNPLALSGGEQTIIALCTALLISARSIAIDCCFEQLSGTVRDRLVANLGHPDVGELMVLIADNRLREYSAPLPVEAVCRGHAAADSAAAGMTDEQFVYSEGAEAIRLRNLRFGYEGRKDLLRDINFVFEPGQIYFLRGDNGIGKSTLAKILCGLLRPAGGRLELGALARWTPWKRPGESVAYHFQNPDLQLFGTRVADLFAGAPELVETFGLQPLLHQHPQDLPFTLRKRVALAAVFARKRSWIVLDEPILGQDDENAACLSRMLDKVAGSGGGVIVITHSDWFSRLSKRAVRIRLTSRELAAES
jgi:energy-coupling factor transporter ATP-binding protein EcfA2